LAIFIKDKEGYPHFLEVGSLVFFHENARDENYQTFMDFIAFFLDFTPHVQS